MNIKEFVEIYKKGNASINEKLIKDHVTRTYVPVGEKRAALMGLTEGSVRIDDNGIKYIDMVANKINYVYGILLLYTDIEPMKNDDAVSMFLETYDLIQENNILNPICTCIGERELNELTFINEQVLDTWYTKNTSTKAYISELVNNVTRTITEITTLLGENADERGIDKETVTEIANKIKEDFLEVPVEE